MLILFLVSRQILKNVIKFIYNEDRVRFGSYESIR